MMALTRHDCRRYCPRIGPINSGGEVCRTFDESAGGLYDEIIAESDPEPSKSFAQVLMTTLRLSPAVSTGKPTYAAYDAYRFARIAPTAYGQGALKKRPA